MFKEMRRNDKQISEEAAIAILKKGMYGVLATIGEDGYPYGVPVNYVYENGKIYFHSSAADGHKGANTRFCDKVCFTVTENVELLADKFNTRFESVVVFGRIKEVPAMKQVILEGMLDKYSAPYRPAGLEYISKAAAKTTVYEISIEAVSGKAKY
ncbi:MAG: pyridoxamine 5'-phosphate oxidase family protein [Syntrophomonadaceae bacterium]|nr:pyridoxamine 5'-phosphate oxidase family protein [Syntrophomonadaceae bacterium]